MIKANVTIYFDTRRKNRKNQYPVRLRVYYHEETRFYHSGILLTEEQFQDSYLNPKPKTQQSKELRIKILALESKAINAADELLHFSFDQFEKKFLRPTGAKNNVFYYYQQIYQQLTIEERLKNASIYDTSAKSLKKFLEWKEKRTDILLFETVTESFLKEYEKWMMQKGKKSSTVGFYLRALRAIFNAAIDEGNIPKDIYPFGKRKFQIPSGSNIKKALKKDELRKLFEYQTDSPFLEKAKDFWLFSYVCNGMNMRDIANLKYRNINSDTISFVRNKTKNSTKSNQKQIMVILIPFAKYVIKKYGSEIKNPDDYIFPIFTNSMTEAEKIREVSTFVRFVNQHIKNLAEKVGINKDISTYWARHTFTTISVQNGASLEFIQDSLGHSSIATTMRYWSGFEEDAKKQIAEQLLNF